MINEISSKSCTPCRGGIPPLGSAEVQRYLTQTPGWTALDADTRIERRFKFANFKEALDFVTEVGRLSEAEGHHPDIGFGWGWASISWQTKKIKGLHENDFIMAAKTNRLAGAS